MNEAQLKQHIKELKQHIKELKQHEAQIKQDLEIYLREYEHRIKQPTMALAQLRAKRIQTEKELMAQKNARVAKELGYGDVSHIL